MQVVGVQISARAFFPFFPFIRLFFNHFFITYWLVPFFSYGWLFTATRGVAINVFLVYYRNFLSRWPNFKRYGGVVLLAFFSRFVAYPVPSPRILGTSRKQGQGKIRRARYGIYMWKCAFSLLSSQRVICISFHIAEHYSLGAWNRLFVLWQEWQFRCSAILWAISGRLFTSIHVQYSPLVQVLKPSVRF